MSIDLEKHGPIPLRIIVLRKIAIEGTFLNIGRAIYYKLMANIIFSGKKLIVFPLIHK